MKKYDDRQQHPTPARRPLLTVAKGILFWALLLTGTARAQNPESIFRTRIACTVGNTTLYADSSYRHPTDVYFGEGELLDVLGQTTKEHYDDAQKQTFRWYRVRSQKGQTGWVFGDAVAVLQPDDQVEAPLRRYHKKSFRFGSGFEQSVLWVATIEGREHFYENEFLNPPYKESYLVITNERRRSVTINFASTGTGGKNELRDLLVQDITGDDNPEIILQRSSLSRGSSLEIRNLEIYAFQAGTLAKVLDERLSLTLADQWPSPSWMKAVEISDQSIRFAYVDYAPCRQDTKQPGDYCTEYVTYSYAWDKSVKQFKALYGESRSALTATLLPGLTASLFEAPARNATRKAAITADTRLQVLRQHENPPAKDATRSDLWLLVRLPDGREGFLPAAWIRFRNTEHADLLQAFYADPPRDKADWKGADLNLVTIERPKSQPPTPR